MYLWSRKNRLNFDNHPPPDSDLGFLTDYSTSPDRTFSHNLAYISAKGDRIFMKFSPKMYPWTKKYPLNFGCNPNSESESGVLIRIRSLNLDQILLGRGIRSLAALVFHILLS